TALLLAGRGYRVAVAAVAAIKRPEPGLRFWKCDVSMESSVHACVRSVVKRFGRLDALVNNAGLTGPSSGPVEKLALKDWNRRLGVNLTGAFLMAKLAVPHRRRARGVSGNFAANQALQS